jgi:hypothetical protein
MEGHIEAYRLKSVEKAKEPKGLSRYVPKDLELFQASTFQQQDAFKGYDKITTAPTHGTLPKWELKQSAVDRLGGWPMGFTGPSS